jgi:hypothetical protein
MASPHQSRRRWRLIENRIVCASPQFMDEPTSPKTTRLDVFAFPDIDR